MSKVNRGKQFETQFANNWKKCFPKTFIFRLKDDTSRHKGSARNPCDFFCMPKDKLFMIETKTHYGNTFPFADFPQYESMLTYRGCSNLIIGVVIWFIDHDRVIFVPLDTVTKMMQDGCKSVNIRKLDGYDYIEIPSKKKRVLMDSDYSILIV